MIITGTVITGTKEGAKYMKLYSNYFKEEFGSDFFPGTLNIQVEEEIQLKDPITIIPKESDLYAVDCYNVKINKFPALLVVPHKTKHSRLVLELISPEHLREKFHLKDGYVVEIEV